jgi:glycosyltransferase involved in cell wall biosynthesis
MKDKRFILYVGNAFPYKTRERLVDAFSLSTHKDLELVLVGKTDYFYEQLRDYIANRGVPRVTLTGFVPDEELAWLYGHTVLYTFPSLSEGFGLPGLEAMLYDVPVVASNATTLPEVYGDAAEYFNPRDPKDIAHAIDTLIDDPERQKQLIAAGRKRTQQFSWSRMAKETLAVYKSHNQ